MVMHEFKNDRIGILVATDIVSRGIDIDDISLIINYDVPHDSEDYVHRIGRTARAGEKGMAITLVSQEEQYKFKLIEDFLEKSIFKIPVPAELGDAPEYKPEENRQKRKSFGGGGKGRGKGKRQSQSKPRSTNPRQSSGKKKVVKKNRPKQ